MLEKANHARIVFGGLIVIALILSVLAHFESRFPGDLEATLLFQSIHSQPLLNAMKTVSYIAGDWRAVILIFIIGVVSWRSMGRLEGGTMLLSGLIAYIGEALKTVINRPRPTADLVSIFVAETGKSFPSGHAFFAVVVLGMLGYLISIHQIRRGLKLLTVSVSIVLILLIGASRIYLGAHWMSDVIGGYVIGLPFLMLEIWLSQRLRLRWGVAGPNPRIG